MQSKVTISIFLDSMVYHEMCVCVCVRVCVDPLILVFEQHYNRQFTAFNPPINFNLPIFHSYKSYKSKSSIQSVVKYFVEMLFFLTEKAKHTNSPRYKNANTANFVKLPL